MSIRSDCFAASEIADRRAVTADFGLTAARSCHACDSVSVAAFDHVDHCFDDQRIELRPAMFNQLLERGIR